MRVWRLARRGYAALDGKGAREWGGRWNSPGRPMVYCSRLLSLAALEYLVHLSPTVAPDDLMAWAVEVPDDAIERLAEDGLPKGWARRVGATRKIGDDWLASGRSAVLVVPSAVLPSALAPDEVNVLVNPGHPASESARIVDQRPFTFDPRLLAKR
ncbi:MAG TPA: RES family NAD+ phosphorylase [Gemmatimonadales bacterium]|nr:RES family NAD+ phosphorylase [Gemmatimonadales bacterium]